MRHTTVRRIGCEHVLGMLVTALDGFGIWITVRATWVLTHGGDTSFEGRSNIRRSPPFIFCPLFVFVLVLPFSCGQDPAGGTHDGTGSAVSQPRGRLRQPIRAASRLQCGRLRILWLSAKCVETNTTRALKFARSGARTCSTALNALSISWRRSVRTAVAASSGTELRPVRRCFAVRIVRVTAACSRRPIVSHRERTARGWS